MQETSFWKSNHSQLNLGLKWNIRLASTSFVRISENAATSWIPAKSVGERRGDLSLSSYLLINSRYISRVSASGGRQLT